MRRIALLILFLSILPVFSLKAEGEVDLLWQGEVYTPPFYEGRSLWTYQSRLSVTAMPNIPNASSLYYRWTKDGTVLGSLSGINKRSITFTDSVLSLPIEIKVDLRDGEDGPVLGSSTIELRAGAPRLLVVENNPLYGVLFNRAVDSEYLLSGDEVTFAALPMFTSVTFRAAPALALSWLTNSGDRREGAEVTYRKPEDTSGSSVVRLRMNNSNTLRQVPEKSFLIRFDDENVF